eukprot:1657837-Amphidinium_carterae.1
MDGTLGTNIYAILAQVLEPGGSHYPVDEASVRVPFLLQHFVYSPSDAKRPCLWMLWLHHANKQE